ncbi:MAG: hypothetical protein J6M53_03265 [Bacteroidaceae bacterium]|nr:hypothetical protein [Bacteroidaceae bacterium]
MRLLLACLLLFLPPGLSDGLIGSWRRTVTTTDETTGTVETQASVRTFADGHRYTETVDYEERLRWADDETVVLRFHSEVAGQWVVSGQDVLLRYKPSTLRVTYEGVSFPDRAAALQPELRAAFERKQRTNLRNYIATMRNVLRGYYKRNSGSALAGVTLQGRQFTATLSNETVAFQRVE